MAASAEQAKANADAAFAVGALCGALDGQGRPRLAERIQERFEQVLAEQDDDGRPATSG